MEPLAESGTLPLPALYSTCDGRLALVRAVRASDLALLEAFINGLSPASRRQRFHGGVRSLPAHLLQRMTRPDPRRELALLAITLEGGQARCIGEARYADGDGPAGEREFALVVADAWQRVGLGAALLDSLSAHADLTGVACLVGDVMRDNTAMIALARRNGHVVRTHPTDPRLLRVSRCRPAVPFDDTRWRAAHASAARGQVPAVALGLPQ